VALTNAKLTPDQDRPGESISSGWVSIPYNEGVQVYALWHGMPDEDAEALVVRRLVEALAWALLPRTDYPGYGFTRANGVTTIWERGDKMEANEMNSHNHPALAGIAGWIFRHVAGLNVKLGSDPLLSYRQQ